ncbi:allantoinase PuuE [Rhizobiales bacterium TNE-4]|nr:allantoinase PuuE [Rhizobiales bacterium TNE-4]MBV1828990.1 allantoinase PuuE [Rhizobiales bacterium TNE-4]
MANDYPRDLIGYGRDAPDPKWPGGARLALQFVVNYEEGAENNILHGDPASEAFLSEIVSAAPWPGQRHMNMESIYEYGSRVGFWRLYRLFTERKIPVTVFGVAHAMMRHPDAVNAMKEAGWEIASHGLKWIDYRDFDPQDEAAQIAEAVRIHTAVTGSRPLGFYQGRTSSHTLQLTQEEGGFLYSADSYADELPYYVTGPNGRSGFGPFLIVPYTLDVNDMRFATPQGFNSGDQFFAYLKDSFDLLYREGAVSPKMMSIGLHCRLVGRPGRAAALKRFLDYVKSFEHVWITTRLDIARHWINNHAPPMGWKPSTLSKAMFITKFGGVFEHTPWIAEKAFLRGLDASHDTAIGLHRALVREMRAGTEMEKRALILAHPDLAGKLAQAKLLTSESTHEQASAGLDQLTESEVERFTSLNIGYKKKFSFPFILAVKGMNKHKILSNFELRLQNSSDQEFETALQQIEKIALLRLMEILP